MPVELMTLSFHQKRHLLKIHLIYATSNLFYDLLFLEGKLSSNSFWSVSCTNFIFLSCDLSFSILDLLIHIIAPENFHTFCFVFVLRLFVLLRYRETCGYMGYSNSTVSCVNGLTSRSSALKHLFLSQTH